MTYKWFETEDGVITGWFYPIYRYEFEEFLKELRTYCKEHKIPIIKTESVPKIREEFYGAEFKVVFDDINDSRFIYYKDPYDGKIETIY